MFFPILLIFFLCRTASFALGESGALPNTGESPEMIALKRRFATIVQERAELEQEREAWTRIAIQPYREYLLIQKSLNFADLSARLEALEREREEIAQDLIRKEPNSEPALKAMIHPPPSAFPLFSGAPPLSFNEVSRADPPPFYRPFRSSQVAFFRVTMFGIVLFILIFPLTALFRMRHLRPPHPVSMDQGSVKKRKGPDQEGPREKAA
jgi:hypothetical protein